MFRYSLISFSTTFRPFVVRLCKYSPTPRIIAANPPSYRLRINLRKEYHLTFYYSLIGELKTMFAFVKHGKHLIDIDALPKLIGKINASICKQPPSKGR